VARALAGQRLDAVEEGVKHAKGVENAHTERPLD
jgi:hypothetical protein